MKANREHLIEVFSRLGSELADFGRCHGSRQVIADAAAANGWFTEQEIISAVDAICAQMLRSDKLAEWLAPYPDASGGRNVAVIMPGNIPLVGFFDMLCVLISGHRLLYKVSSKDSILTEYIIGRLLRIDPSLPLEPFEGQIPDAAIATGSDNTNRYFRSRFGNIPALFRGSRASAGVLTGDESEEQLAALSRDIFSYSGLGCRNVSHLILPADYDIGALATALASYENINPKYRNNYRQRKAVLTMQKLPFADGGFFILRKDDDFPAPVSEITHHTYSCPEEITAWIAAHSHEIQCVADSYGQYLRGVRFGQTQSPALTDYPDGVDTMSFLTAL